MNSGISVTQIRDKGHIFLLIAMLFVAGIMPMYLLCPILIVLFGLMLGILIISVFSPEDFNFLFTIYAIGFVVRIFASCFFYIFSFTLRGNHSPGFIFPNDGWSYSQQGWQIFKFAERGIKVTIENFIRDPNMFVVGACSGNITTYDFFASYVYSITGYSPLSLFFISSLAGSMAALFIYLITKELFSKRVARISALFAFFWPSFILWSTQNLKEPMIAVFIFILLWSLFYAYRHLAPGFLLFSIISVLVLLEIGMPYLAIIVSMTFFVSLFLFINYLSKSKLITILIVSFLCVISFIVLRDRVLSFIFEKSDYIMKQESVWEFLNYHRNVRAYGRLQFLKGIDISSAGKAIVFAPLGLLFVIFAPFPWQLGSVMQVMAVPETILFYILIPFTIKGIVFSYRKRFNQSFLLLSIIFGLFLFLALVEGNSGTLFRHRSIAFYLVFMFTAEGLSLKNEK